MNSFSTFVEIEPAENLVKKLRAEGYNSIGLMHVIIAAYIRAVSQRPKVNRYIRGQRVYARNGIVVNLTVKKKMSLDAEETAMKMYFDPSDTLFDVYSKFTSEYEKIVGIGAEENGTDRFARIVMSVPRFLINGCVGLLRILDYYDLIPMSLLEISPFHGSMFITNMASLNIPPVTHHLYDFGNVPIFIAFGTKRVELVANDDGTNPDADTCDDDEDQDYDQEPVVPGEEAFGLGRNLLGGSQSLVLVFHLISIPLISD